MNKIAVGVVVVLVLGGVVYAYQQMQSDKKTVDSMMAEGEVMMTEDNAMMEGEKQMEGEVMMEDDSMMQAEATMEGEAMMESDAMMSTGVYEVYAPEKLAAAKNGDVVLFFKASWCPSCRALDTNIKANSGDIPSDLTLLEVDYDTSTDLRQKYGVTMQHTLVQVDAEGNLINKWSGGETLDSVIAKVQ